MDPFFMGTCRSRVHGPARPSQGGALPEFFDDPGAHSRHETPEWRHCVAPEIPGEGLARPGSRSRGNQRALPDQRRDPHDLEPEASSRPTRRAAPRGVRSHDRE
jgi:hypothetical protein